MSTALAEMSGPEVEHKGWLKDFNAQNHGGSQQTSKLIKHLFILVAKPRFRMVEEGPEVEEIQNDRFRQIRSLGACTASRSGWTVQLS
jgi:hypothetical protein